jgi:hypothetical protein
MLLVQQPEAESLLAAGNQCPTTSTLAWLRQYIAQPNREVGRPGTVCPFVPKALRLTCLWFAQVPFAELATELQQLKEQFFLLEPTDPERRIGKTVLLIVEDMPEKFLLDGEWLTWLASYLEVGLKITAFHPKNPQRGMHNPDFLSHVSPYPLLAVRHLHPRDSAFVAQLVGTREGELLAAGYARLFKT